MMDILNLWNDDPEEVLLDLGFGTDESELSGRIPARFINHQSQARGINLQLFLESQKNRLDLENPHVNSRFRQLEVFQQVTTAFSSLVGTSCSSLRVPQGKDLPPDALERRKHIRMLFRQASKKSLLQTHNNNTLDLTTPASTSPSCAASAPLQPPPNLGDKPVLLKRIKPGLQEMVCLSALKEEEGAGPDLYTQSLMASLAVQEGVVRPCPASEGQLIIADTALPWKKSPGKVKESIEMDEALSGLSGRSSEKPQSEMEKPPASSSPASLPALACEYLPFCSPSLELQNVTHLQSPAPSSPTFYTSLSPATSSMQPGSLIKGSEIIKTEDKNASSPSPPPLSTPPHDSEGTALSIISTAAPLASSPSPSPHVNYPCFASTSMCSTQSDSAYGSPGNSQSDQTEMVLHGHSLPAHGRLTCLCPSSPNLPTYTTPDFYCPSSLASPPQTETLSQSSENNQNVSLFPISGERGLSDPPTDKDMKDKETPLSLSCEFYIDSLLAPPSRHLDSFKLKKDGGKLPCLSPNPSIPVCLSSFLSELRDPDSLIDKNVGIMSDLTEQSILQWDRSYSHDDNTNPAPASPDQDVTHAKTDHLSLEDTLQINAKEEVEGEKHDDNVQTKEALVYSSDTKNFTILSEGSRFKAVCDQTEGKPQAARCSFHEHPMETKPKELMKLCQMEMNVTENELLATFLVLQDDVPEAQIISKDECEERILKDLIEIDSLDQVFHTSVDGSESENGDVEAFFQQIYTEGLVYWAEPINVFNPTPVLEHSFEAADGSPISPNAPDSSTTKAVAFPLSSSTTMGTGQTASSDMTSSSTTIPSPALTTTQDLKPSSRSVSVQMSSSPSSHIVHRRDIPFMTDSKRTLLPRVLPLDTSTPFRAVQSWTDLQLQQNILTKMYSHDTAHTAQNKDTVSTSQMTQRPTHSLPQLSPDRQSHDCFYGMARNDHNVSGSVYEGLRLDEEMDRSGNEDEEKLWEGSQTATTACYCTCDHQCACCTQKSSKKQQTLENVPDPMDDLEEMMLCLQQYCSMFTNMEEQLSEDQSAVYSALSDQDREKLWDIEELRRVVKQEAGELEMHLNELAHLYDDGLKTKMHRLLDELSLLCSELRVFLPATVPTSLSSASTRATATQRCLLSWIPSANMQSCHVSSWNTRNVNSTSQSSPGSDEMGCCLAKADKLDIAGFLQSTKTSYCDT